MMMAVFDQVGIGQWFRLVTGLIEIIPAKDAIIVFSGVSLA